MAHEYEGNMVNEFDEATTTEEDLANFRYFTLKEDFDKLTDAIHKAMDRHTEYEKRIGIDALVSDIGFLKRLVTDHYGNKVDAELDLQMCQHTVEKIVIAARSLITLYKNPKLANYYDQDYTQLMRERVDALNALVKR